MELPCTPIFNMKVGNRSKVSGIACDENGVVCQSNCGYLEIHGSVPSVLGAELVELKRCGIVEVHYCDKSVALEEAFQLAISTNLVGSDTLLSDSC
jgi:hypothetical protein